MSHRGRAAASGLSAVTVTATCTPDRATAALSLTVS
jgi:hypothetical protein